MEYFEVIKRNGTIIPLLSREPGHFCAVKSAQLTKALMGDDYIKLSIVSAEKLNLSKGDKIVWAGDEYFVRTVPTTEILSESYFSIEVTFYGVIYDLMKTLYRNTDHNGRSSSSKFDLTYSLKDFVKVLIHNLERDYPGLWAFDEENCPETTPKTLSFNNQNGLSFLQFVCKEFGYEFVVKQNNGVRTIHIGMFGNRVNPPSGTEFFEWGRNNGLFSLKEEKVDDKAVITRLWVEGGSTNIRTEYRDYAGRLQLPYPRRKNARQHTLWDGTVIEPDTAWIGIDDDSKRYLEDAALRNAIGSDEDGYQNDEIYPKRTGRVTAKVTGDECSFVDDTMDFDLNAKTDGKTLYLVDGVSAKVTFISGKLAGQEFELAKYDAPNKKFTLIPYTDERGLTVPTTDTDAFQIAETDEYKLTDIFLPESYEKAAEEDLWFDGLNQFMPRTQARVQYSLALDRAYFLDNLPDGGDVRVFDVGDYVPVKDERFGIEKNIRIVKLIRNLILEQDYQLTLADEVNINIYTQTILDVKKHEQIIQSNRLRDIGRAKRGWRTTEELRNMIYDTDGFFDTDNIRPNSIDTNVLTVGSKSQQFVLTGVIIEPNYQGNPNIINISNGLLCHLTASETEIKTWNMSALNQQLTASNGYYLFAKCSKTSNGGVWYVTTEQLRVENTEDPNNYYFQVGIIGSLPQGETWRDFVTTYGFTRINGNTITTGRIVTSDGGCYLDLDGNKFRIGDDSSWIDYNANNDHKLRLHNVVLVSGSGDTDNIGVYRGEYDSTKTYYKGDEVSYTNAGETYTIRYINSTPTIGSNPTDLNFWMVVAKGISGTSIFYTYNDQESKPNNPTGAGNTNGWHTNSTQSVVWMSIKSGKTINDGTWGEPIRVRGADGTSVRIKGTVSNVSQLPSSGNNVGDCYIVGDNLHTWNGTSWQNLGQFRGNNGTSSYLHIKYSNDGGTTFTDGNGETTGEYIGVLVDQNPQDSDNPADYNWSKMQGKDGISFAGTDEYYKWHTSGTNSPNDSGWSVNVIPAKPQDKSYKYLWNYEIVRKSDGTTLPATAKHLIGSDGKEVDYFEEFYKTTDSISEPTADSAEWKSFMPDPTEDKPYLWNKEIVHYTDGTLDTKIHLIAKKGKDADAHIVTVVSRTFGTGTDAPHTTTIDDETVTHRSGTRSLCVEKLDVSGRFCEEYREFDTYEDPDKNYAQAQSDFVSYVNQLNNYSGIVVVASSDAIALTSEMIAALKPFGIGNIEPLESGRHAFAFIGQYGMAEGTAYWSITSNPESAYNTQRTAITKASVVKNVVTPRGSDGVSYTGTDEYYKWSASGSSAPTGTWTKNAIPAKPSATYKYLWNYEVIQKDDGTSIETAKHLIGSDGKGISNVTESYKLTATFTKPGASDSGWQSVMPDPTDSESYLWNKEVISYTDGTSDTNIHLLARKGADGTSYAGTDEYYQWHTNGTTAPTGTWTKNSIPAKPGNSYKFLWNYEIIKKSDGSSETTAKRPLGSDGKGISSIAEYYMTSSSFSTPADNHADWSAVMPEPTNAKPYLWDKEVISYTDGTSDTNIHLLARKGDMGLSVNNNLLDGCGFSNLSKWSEHCGTVVNGIDGNKAFFCNAFISDVDMEIAVGTSTTTAPTSGWSLSIPTSRTYLWGRIVSTIQEDGRKRYGTPFRIPASSGTTLIKNWAYSSSSSTTAPSNGWGETKLSWRLGTRVWMRLVVATSSGASFTTAQANPQGGDNGYVDILGQIVYKTVPKLESNTWYTLSFWTKGIGGNLSTYVYPSIIDTNANAVKDNIEESTATDGHSTWNLTQTFSFHTYTFKTKASIPSTDQKVFFRIWDGTEAYICMPKLEKGTEASSWCLSEADKVGVSYGGTDEYYQWGTNNSYAPTGSWTKNSIPTKPNATYKYLWNYEEIKDSNGGKTTTPKHIVSSDGKGIDHFTEYYKLTSTFSTPAENDSGWTTNQLQVTSSNPFLWNKEVCTYTDSSTETHIRLIARMGTNGESPALVYRGEYSSSAVYYGTSYRVDAVKYNGAYYVASVTAGEFSGCYPVNTEYWKPFGTNFESVATYLLLAENAAIAGWIFKDGYLISQRGKLYTNGSVIDSSDYTNPNYVPNVTLNGITGEVMVGRYALLDADNGLQLLNSTLGISTQIVSKSVGSVAALGAADYAGVYSYQAKGMFYMNPPVPGTNQPPPPPITVTEDTSVVCDCNLGYLETGATLRIGTITSQFIVPSSSFLTVYAGMCSIYAEIYKDGGLVDTVSLGGDSSGKTSGEIVTITTNRTLNHTIGTTKFSDNTTTQPGSYSIKIIQETTFSTSSIPNYGQYPIGTSVTVGIAEFGVSVGKKCLIGNDGMYVLWGSNKFFFVSFNEGMTCRVGNAGIRVTTTGLQKLNSSGNWVAL